MSDIVNITAPRTDPSQVEETRLGRVMSVGSHG